MAQDYTYLVARLRAIEASMPDQAWFQRIARTPAGSVLGAVREFYRGFDTVDSLYDFEDGLESEKVSFLDLLDSLVDDGRVRTFLRAGHDFDNLVHAFKAFRLGAPAAMNPFGLVGPEAIGKAVTGVSRIDLPGWLKTGLEQLEALGESVDPALLEDEGCRARWEFLLSAAPGAAATEYAVWMIDMVNIKRFLRLKRTPLRTGSRGPSWIGGGEIDAPTLSALLRVPEDEFHSYMAFTSHRGMAALGLGPSMPLWMIDAVITRHMLGRTGESRYRFFDMGPLLYHILLRERDEQLLRMILTGCLNRLPDERILEGVEAMTA